jgi:hypothetical protein
VDEANTDLPAGPPAGAPNGEEPVAAAPNGEAEALASFPKPDDANLLSEVRGLSDFVRDLEARAP